MAASVQASHIDLGADSVAIVGAGLVGCLLGLYLRKHGRQVTIFESRSDPRLAADGGRSINLVLTSRGIQALCGVSDSLAERIMKTTVPVFGRSIHQQTADGGTAIVYQAYGPDHSHCNFSVSRWELNCLLLQAADEAGCRLHFNHPLAHVDVAAGTLYFYLQDAASTQLYQKSATAAHIFAADGGGSRCRQALVAHLARTAPSQQVSDVGVPLGYGYKELTIPESARQLIDPDSLHIWPRGSHFMMALPNRGGSQTVTLYLPNTGDDVSFQAIDSPERVLAYFRRYYPDAVALMPDLTAQYMRNPVGFLGTVFAAPWVYADKLALVGDAAHAITPFFGQGCNCGFEDVYLISELLQRHAGDMAALFAEYYRVRKPNADAIANMAIDNFDEMMNKTGNARFLLEKDIENALSLRFPVYASRYVLITHSLLPYRQCMEIGQIQSRILAELSANITDVAQLDYAAAQRLINEHLLPYLNHHAITPDHYNFTSKFYPTKHPRL